MINQPSKQELDAAIRKVFNDLDQSLNNLLELKKFVDGKTASDLTTVGAGYEYAQVDVDNLKAAVFQANYDALVNTARNASSGVLTFLSRLAGINFARRQ